MKVGKKGRPEQAFAAIIAKTGESIPCLILLYHPNHIQQTQLITGYNLGSKIILMNPTAELEELKKCLCQ